MVKIGSALLPGPVRNRQQITDWAKATYRKLPRELRDMVYEHLWSGDTAPIVTTDIFSTYRTTSRPAFVVPIIVGEDFAREVVEWYYEHGCVGHAVPVTDLQQFLVSDFFGVGLMPTTCELRSLTVRINIRSETFMLDDLAVFRGLKCLLDLELIEGFKLTILMRITFGEKLSTDPLKALGSYVQRKIQEFESKGCNLMVQFEIKQEREGGRTQNIWPSPYEYGLSLSPHRPLLHHYIEGHVAKDMLAATTTQWKDYLRQHMGEAWFTIIGFF
ncbi:Nn.00g117090.m01.CDS01 [Neocucurbitaria sp. VM-36]